MDKDVRGAAFDFLASQKTGVLSTLSPAGTPRARLVYYACDGMFAVYFITLANTRKAEDLAAHPQAAFTVSSEAVPQTVQIEGTVEDVTERSIIDPVLVELFKHLNSNTAYGAPLMHFDRADIRFYKLTPSWVRYGDFTSGHHTDEVLEEILP
ncbi:MAG: pyridoxamine 5'-phosphate oxidase family protein [Candidatus Pacebacteria bacterium]|nr:pyridoxamine 5'-phosphate oxidase family protein [Candidatus Paceibacterota bacterium]